MRLRRPPVGNQNNHQQNNGLGRGVAEMKDAFGGLRLRWSGVSARETAPEMKSQK